MPEAYLFPCKTLLRKGEKRQEPSRALYQNGKLPKKKREVERKLMLRELAKRKGLKKEDEGVVQRGVQKRRAHEERRPEVKGNSRT